MPEMLFDVRWPNGATQRCYSPSLVIRDHFLAGASYEIGDFLTRSRSALNEASERVRLRYGMPCSRAIGQLAEIESRAGGFPAGATVTVLAFHDVD